MKSVLRFANDPRIAMEMSGLQVRAALVSLVNQQTAHGSLAHPHGTRIIAHATTIPMAIEGVISAPRRTHIMATNSTDLRDVKGLMTITTQTGLMTITAQTVPHAAERHGQTIVSIRAHMNVNDLRRMVSGTTGSNDATGTRLGAMNDLTTALNATNVALASLTAIDAPRERAIAILAHPAPLKRATHRIRAGKVAPLHSESAAIAGNRRTSNHAQVANGTRETTNVLTISTNSRVLTSVLQGDTKTTIRADAMRGTQEGRGKSGQKATNLM